MASSFTNNLVKLPGSRDDILRKLRERMVGFAASRLQRDAAEDLAQEVLLLLHTKYGHLDQLEDLLPLSLRVLRFKILAYRTTARRHGEHAPAPTEQLELPDRHADALTALEQREARERLIAAIGQLGERCRKILGLKLEGKNFVEIQSILKAATLNTVYTWDFRCRQQLIAALDSPKTDRKNAR